MPKSSENKCELVVAACHCPRRRRSSVNFGRPAPSGMSDVVVDANVAVKWVLEEEHSDRAQKLFEDVVSAHDRLIGPPILISEVVSVIFQRRRSRDPERRISE